MKSSGRLSTKDHRIRPSYIERRIQYTCKEGILEGLKDTAKSRRLIIEGEGRKEAAEEAMVRSR